MKWLCAGSPLQLVARNRLTSASSAQGVFYGKDGHGARRERGITVEELGLMKLDMEDRLVLRLAAWTLSKTMGHCSGPPS